MARSPPRPLAVLEALLWGFHNAKSGLCFPSYQTLAEAAGCARSTVAEAIKALEDAGVLSWVNRIKRVAEENCDLFGHRIRKTRVIRTSNGYVFLDPQLSKRPESLKKTSKSDFPSGTPTQESLLHKPAPASRVLNPDNPLEGALIRLGRALGAAPRRVDPRRHGHGVRDAQETVRLSTSKWTGRGAARDRPDRTDSLHA